MIQRAVIIKRGCAVGGNANNGANDGLAYVNSNNSVSNTNANIGSRTCYNIAMIKPRHLAKHYKENTALVGLPEEDVTKQSNRMKRYGNLFERVCSMENLREADRKARKGKAHKYGVRAFDRNSEGNLLLLQKNLLDGTFHTSTYVKMKIYEPKERIIFKLPYYPDRIVHHAIVNVCEPIWMATLTADTFACIKGRGLHACAKRVRDDLRHDPEGTKYCLKIDVRKYYPSIDHEILKKQIRRKIKDVRLLALLDEIIDSEQGLPIGNYLSQHLANLYLCDFDHRIKERYNVRYYYRYVDDMVFLAATKSELHELLEAIKKELAELNLSIKGNWQIFPVDSRGIDFVGYRFFHSFTLLRKTIKKAIFAKASRLRKGLIKLETWKRSYASWHGWLKWCDSHRLETKIISLTT